MSLSRSRNQRRNASQGEVRDGLLTDSALRSMFGSGYDKYFDSFRSSYEGDITTDTRRTDRGSYMARRGSGNASTTYTERTYSEQFLADFREHLDVSRAMAAEQASADARMRSAGGRAGLARDIMLRRQAQRRRAQGSPPAAGTATSAILGATTGVTLGGSTGVKLGGG